MSASLSVLSLRIISIGATPWDWNAPLVMPTWRRAWVNCPKIKKELEQIKSVVKKRGKWCHRGTLQTSGQLFKNLMEHGNPMFCCPGSDNPSYFSAVFSKQNWIGSQWSRYTLFQMTKSGLLVHCGAPKGTRWWGKMSMLLHSLRKLVHCIHTINLAFIHK